MIFSQANHIEQIKAGLKTQTRRPSPRYRKGHTYAIQPGRTKPGIPEGRILITQKWCEVSYINSTISPAAAAAEGGYTPEEYEQLYAEMYPNWSHRWAYTFEYIPNTQKPLTDYGEATA